jgi:hypothetical protein
MATIGTVTYPTSTTWQVTISAATPGEAVTTTVASDQGEFVSLSFNAAPPGVPHSLRSISFGSGLASVAASAVVYLAVSFGGTSAVASRSVANVATGQVVTSLTSTSTTSAVSSVRPGAMSAGYAATRGTETVNITAVGPTSPHNLRAVAISDGIQSSPALAAVYLSSAPAASVAGLSAATTQALTSLTVGAHITGRADTSVLGIVSLQNPSTQSLRAVAYGQGAGSAAAQATIRVAPSQLVQFTAESDTTSQGVVDWSASVLPAGVSTAVTSSAVSASAGASLRGGSDARSTGQVGILAVPVLHHFTAESDTKTVAQTHSAPGAAITGRASTALSSIVAIRVPTRESLYNHCKVIILRQHPRLPGHVRKSRA